jgi:hypothetical protein
LLETHLFYAGDQSGGLHPQKLRGTIHAFDLPAGLFQDRQKILSFALLLDFQESLQIAYVSGTFWRASVILIET